MRTPDARERAVQILARMEQRGSDKLDRAFRRGRDLHRHVAFGPGEVERARWAMEEVHRLEMMEMAESPDEVRNDLAEQHDAEMRGFMSGFDLAREGA